jgi:hypothetical protein
MLKPMQSTTTALARGALRTDRKAHRRVISMRYGRTKEDERATKKERSVGFDGWAAVARR